MSLQMNPRPALPTRDPERAAYRGAMVSANIGNIRASAAGTSPRRFAQSDASAGKATVPQGKATVSGFRPQDTVRVVRFFIKPKLNLNARQYSGPRNPIAAKAFASKATTGARHIPGA